MHTDTITNPKTGRSNAVRVWDIEPKAIVAGLREGRYTTARDISYALLNEKRSLAHMERELDGESARVNFALSVFENALDWRLGMAILDVLKAYSDKYGKYPKPFQVAVNRSGDIFILFPSGRIVTA